MTTGPPIRWQMWVCLHWARQGGHSPGSWGGDRRVVTAILISILSIMIIMIIIAIIIIMKKLF